MKRIITLLMLLLMPNLILAYEDKYFSIDIPDSYKEEIINENKTEYIWELKNNNKQNIVITIIDNPSTNKQIISKYTEKDLKEYKKTITNTLNKETKEYNVNVDIKDFKKEKINNFNSITYETKWNSKSSLGYDLYQYSYVFTTNNHIITLIYSSDKEKDNEFDSVLSTFKIKEKEILDTSFFSNEKNQIIVVGLSAAFIGFIVSLLTRKKTK